MDSPACKSYCPGVIFAWHVFDYGIYTSIFVLILSWLVEAKKSQLNDHPQDGNINQFKSFKTKVLLKGLDPVAAPQIAKPRDLKGDHLGQTWETWEETVGKWPLTSNFGFIRHLRTEVKLIDLNTVLT